MPIPVSATPVRKRKYFPSENDTDQGLFSGFATGDEGENQVGSLVNENLEGMLTGEAFDATKTQQRESFARAAKNLRTTSGQANAAAIGQGVATKAQGRVEQNIFQGLADTETGLAVEEQAMKERGIGMASDIGQAEQDIITQRRGQDIGLLVSREQLSEGARQFNISTTQAQKQFEDSLKFDYSQLSQVDKQFLASLGLDEAKFEASKQQFQQQLEQQGRLTMAELNVREKELAETGRQFDSKIEFDTWATEQQLDDNEKNRVWQAIQNESANENRVDIAKMYIDQEKWMQDEIDTLTRDGWTTEDARALAQQRHEETLQINDNELRREIESGRVTMADGNTFDTVQLQGLLETARQFDDRIDFEEKMLAVQAMDEDGNLLFNNDGTPKMIDRETAGRLWETNERIAQNAFLAGESDLSRQLQKQIQTGKITMADGSAFDTVQLRELLDRTMLQNDQQEFLKDMSKVQAMDEEGNLLVNDDGTPKMIDRDTANRIWQAAEASKDRVQEAQLQTLQNEFTEKGWNFQALIGTIEYLPDKLVANMLREVSIKTGITHTATDAEGNILKGDDGEAIQLPGFKDYGASERLGFDEAYGEWKPGENTTYTIAESASIMANIDELREQGKAVADTGIESVNPVVWTTEGKNRWKLTGDAFKWAADNIGQLYKASNGRLYEVIGIQDANASKRHSRGSIVFRDTVSNINFYYSSGSGFPE